MKRQYTLPVRAIPMSALSEMSGLREEFRTITGRYPAGEYSLLELRALVNGVRTDGGIDADFDDAGQMTWVGRVWLAVTTRDGRSREPMSLE